MTRKRVYPFVFFLAIIVQGYGQQDPQFSQYMYAILPINPGIAGTAGICATLHYRQQWAGFYDSTENGIHKSSPRDIMFTLHAPIKKLHGGLGLTVLNDAAGFQTDITVKLAYSFKMNIGGGVLGIGPSFDLLSRKILTDHWVMGKSSDPILVNGMGKSDMYFDVSLGAYYEMQNKWYAGISATQLLCVIGGDKVYQKGARHLYALGGYTYVIPSNPNWVLKPSALLKTDFKAVQVDITMAAEWSELFWFGATYRAIDAVVLMAGAKPFVNYPSAIRGLEVAVAYDITTSQMNAYRRGFDGRSFGSPEVVVKYCFNIVTKPTIYGYKGTRLLGNRPIEYR